MYSSKRVPTQCSEGKEIFPNPEDFNKLGSEMCPSREVIGKVESSNLDEVNFMIPDFMKLA